jgi:hypothetical protein
LSFHFDFLLQQKTQMKKTILIIVLATLWPFFRVLAQNYSGNKTPDSIIIGRVFSAFDNRPLLGATVQVKKEKLITTTDETGQFKLHNEEKKGELTITFLGYKSKVIGFDRNTKYPLEISLLQDSSMLEEVVVATGYQSIPEDRSTGSFSQIEG